MLKPDYQNKLQETTKAGKPGKLTGLPAYCPGKAGKLERLLLRITQQQQKSTKKNNTRYYNVLALGLAQLARLDLMPAV